MSKINIPTKTIKGVQKYLRGRERKPELSEKDLAAIKEKLDAGVTDVDLIGSHVVSERDYAPKDDEANVPDGDTNDADTGSEGEAEGAESEGEAEGVEMPEGNATIGHTPVLHPSDRDENRAQCLIVIDGNFSLTSAKIWAAWHADKLGMTIRLVDVDDVNKTIATFVGKGAPDKGAALADAPRLAARSTRTAPSDGANDDAAPKDRAQRNGRGLSDKYAAIIEKMIELASRKEGVKRSELTKANDGTSLNWKGMMERSAKRLKRKLTITKDGSDSVYILAAAA